MASVPLRPSGLPSVSGPWLPVSTVVRAARLIPRDLPPRRPTSVLATWPAAVAFAIGLCPRLPPMVVLDMPVRLQCRARPFAVVFVTPLLLFLPFSLCLGNLLSDCLQLCLCMCSLLLQLVDFLPSPPLLLQTAPREIGVLALPPPEPLRLLRRLPRRLLLENPPELVELLLSLARLLLCSHVFFLLLLFLLLDLLLPLPPPRRLHSLLLVPSSRRLL
mmetsp:Transcript_138166/g.441494  ORF Transcript_138166/g.441494 Transcript_138166/m.441494 type:complete len:218 (+) Transcript_138166:294-947(+)